MFLFCMGFRMADFFHFVFFVKDLIRLLSYPSFLVYSFFWDIFVGTLFSPPTLFFRDACYRVNEITRIHSGVAVTRFFTFFFCPRGQYIETPLSGRAMNTDKYTAQQHTAHNTPDTQQ